MWMRLAPLIQRRSMRCFDSRATMAMVCDGMKATDAGDSFTRGPWPAAAVRCWNSPGGFVLGINRAGDGSRAAGVADRWLGGARTNQALCSNQTNHVAELRIQLTTRSIPGATVGDLKMADRGSGPVVQMQVSMLRHTRWHRQERVFVRYCR